MEQIPQVLKSQTNWDKLHCYQKSDVLYQLTFTFCKRFLPLYGDRTVDQMVQAARSGKQNIVEGSADGASSTEMELKLLNVARASIRELLEDYRDYLLSRKLTLWERGHERFQPMINFCKVHNELKDYQPYFDKWTAEEMANIGLTLCHMTDAMLHTHLKNRESQFVQEGGLKERMHAARTGYRKNQDERLAWLERENARLLALLRKHGIDPDEGQG